LPRVLNPYPARLQSTSCRPAVVGTVGYRSRARSLRQACRAPRLGRWKPIITIPTGPAPSSDTTGDKLRELGAFEQVFHHFIHRNPTHFSLSIHLDGSPGQERLRSALVELQGVHPLLAATVADGDVDAEGSPTFRHVAAPVPLVTSPLGTTWQQVVAQEQARPFETASGPLWRMTLIGADGAGATIPGTFSTLVMTFDHRIADGTAGVRVVRDLVAVLNGRHLPPEPLPATQESLLDAVTDDLGPSGEPSGDRGGDQTVGQGDPRLAMPGALRPFDGTEPEVTNVALDVGATEALVGAARTHGVSVHAALCAATTQVLQRAGRDYVRIITPVDLRRTVGLRDDVAIRIVPTRTGIAAGNGEGFWNLAAAIGAGQTPARTPAAVLATSAAMQANLPPDPDAAEAGMLAIGSSDTYLTNLGVVDLPDSGPLHVVALEGLAMSVHIVGEQVLGALTYRGELRMTNVTHAPIRSFLRDVVQVLRDVA